MRVGVELRTRLLNSNVITNGSATVSDRRLRRHRLHITILFSRHRSFSPQGQKERSNKCTIRQSTNQTLRLYCRLQLMDSTQRCMLEHHNATQKRLATTRAQFRNSMLPDSKNLKWKHWQAAQVSSNPACW
jgi:hypothetical protein